MKYMLLVCGDDTADASGMTPVEPWVEELGDRGVRLHGHTTPAGPRGWTRPHDPVSPEDQDPTAWNRAEAEEGAALLETTLRRGKPGPYQIQAAIAACHTTASTAADTDWADIAGLYGELERFVPSAVIRLNRAFAVGMAEGPEAGLALVAGLEREGELADYHLLPATRADLLRRAGRRGGRRGLRAGTGARGTTPSGGS